MATRPFERLAWPVPRDLVERICAHIAATGEPEGLAELHGGPISKDEPFLIVRDVSIARGRRADGGMAPCPMCQPNKFLDGRLVWFTQLEALAAIGHCCANRETRIAAEREFRAREAKARTEDFLLQVLPGLAALRADHAAIAPRAAATQAVFERFRHTGAAFQRALRQAIKGSGLLSVAEVIGPRMQGGPSGLRTAGSTVETRDVSFGILSGPAAVASRCHIADDLAAIGGLLDGFPAIADEDSALDYLAGLDDASLLACERGLRDIQKKFAEIGVRLNDIASFFTAANAKRITAWGSHRDASFRMRASCRLARLAHQVEFEIVGGDSGRRVGLLLPPVFWADGRLPATL
ncbi:MAG: hypothetical protein JWQ16_1046 [Novosphingobium sp.]|nr:hypothetical protein [Novosphingobium sp.]